MKETLAPGIEYEFTYTVTEEKTVPSLFPEATDFQVMPKVLATGFMVGLFEWYCIQALKPGLHLPKAEG